MIPEKKDYSCYYYKKMPEEGFLVDVRKKTLCRGEHFDMHWHEHMQFYYITAGTAFLKCGASEFEAGAGNFVVVNSCEPHFMESLSNTLEFYIIRTDLSTSPETNTDICQSKFFLPLSQSRIQFKNLIPDDADILACATHIIREYTEKKTAYELAVRSWIYMLIALLLRGYIRQTLTPAEFAIKKDSMKRFKSVFSYIEKHYTEKISGTAIAELAHLSRFHFCRTFRNITGNTLTEYVTSLRLQKAAVLLREQNLTITDIAFRCGFDSQNYFSRSFKKYYGTSPAAFRKEYTSALKT